MLAVVVVVIFFSILLMCLIDLYFLLSLCICLSICMSSIEKYPDACVRSIIFSLSLLTVVSNTNSLYLRLIYFFLYKSK